MVIAVISPAVTGNLCSVRNPVGTAVYFSGSEKKRKIALGNSLACFGGAGRLLSSLVAKAPKGQWTATSPQITSCQNVKTAPARTTQTGAGREQDGNARTSRSQGYAGGKPKAGSRDILPSATERRAAGARSPRQPRKGDGWQKDKRDLHEGGLHPEREKPSEALFFPSSCTCRDCLAAKKFRLCGRRFVSLRKAVLFLPRKNTRRDGEMLHTNSFSTHVLTVRLLLAAVRPVIETRKRKENLSS